MTGYELKKILNNQESRDRCFIKWWRKENDFADYELVDKFLEHLSPESQFEGYELLDMDEMLEELKRYASDRVWMEEHQHRPFLRWRHPDRKGELRDDTYRYSAEVLMALFDQETRGDTLC